MPQAVKDGARQFGLDFASYRIAYIDEAAVRAGVDPPPFSEIDQSTEPLPARVNWNRWIVDCPECRNAMFVWLESPLFLCTTCWNVAVGGKWRLVSVPANWAEIEAVLRARLLPQNRNWEANEAVADLQAENVANGDPLSA